MSPTRQMRQGSDMRWSKCILNKLSKRKGEYLFIYLKKLLFAIVITVGTSYMRIE